MFLAATDGASSPLAAVANAHMGTVSAKVGHAMSWYQSALSFYSESESGGLRFERWAYGGLTHYGPFAVLGEVACLSTALLLMPSALVLRQRRSPETPPADRTAVASEPVKTPVFPQDRSQA